MEPWKKAVIAGAVGAAAVLFLKKKVPAGVLAGGVALAVVAAEYPEKFELVRQRLPDYFDRGMRVMEMAARAGRSGLRKRRGRRAVWRRWAGRLGAGLGLEFDAGELVLAHQPSTPRSATAIDCE